MMPGMSGDQVVAELRRDRALDHVPILLLSARADDELRLRLLREGAQDYLMKPFAADELRGPGSTLQRMSASVARLQELNEGLLQYTRIQSGRLRTEPACFALDELAADVLEELRPQAEAKGLALELAPAPGAHGALPSLHSDRRLVRLILVNANAIKFTDAGRVTLSLAHDGASHWLAVSDTGPGIPPEHRTRIFEPFEQVEPARRKHVAGVGLGLALVREMAASLQGKVSERGPGQVRAPPAHQ